MVSPICMSFGNSYLLLAIMLSSFPISLLKRSEKYHSSNAFAKWNETPFRKNLRFKLLVLLAYHSSLYDFHVGVGVKNKIPLQVPRGSTTISLQASNPIIFTWIAAVLLVYVSPVADCFSWKFSGSNLPDSGRGQLSARNKTYYFYLQRWNISDLSLSRNTSPYMGMDMIKQYSTIQLRE